VVHLASLWIHHQLFKKMDGVFLYNGEKKLLLRNKRKPKNVSKVKVAETVTILKDVAFMNLAMLISIDLPPTLTSIGSHSFRGCKSLKSIDLPPMIDSIGDSAFWGCKSLTSINLPPTLATIGDAAFWGCKSLTSINLPATVTFIGYCAFHSCESLTLINLPASIKSIDDMTFISCTTLNQALKIPRGVHTMRLFLEQRFDILPLHRLCYYYHADHSLTEIRRCLTNGEATARNVDALGMTALHILLTQPKIDVEIVKILLLYIPSSVIQKDTTGKTPLDYLRMNYYCSVTEEVEGLLSQKSERLSRAISTRSLGAHWRWRCSKSGDEILFDVLMYSRTFSSLKDIEGTRYTLLIGIYTCPSPHGGFHFGTIYIGVNSLLSETALSHLGGGIGGLLSVHRVMWSWPKLWQVLKDNIVILRQSRISIEWMLPNESLFLSQKGFGVSIILFVTRMFFIQMISLAVKYYFAPFSVNIPLFLSNSRTLIESEDATGWYEQVDDSLIRYDTVLCIRCYV